MEPSTSKWKAPCAAAWLKQHWGTGRQAPQAALPAPVAAVPVAAELSDFEEDIDIAGWPALVAPFYD